MTVLKVADDRQPDLEVLDQLRSRPDIDAGTRRRIEDEIRAIRAGGAGEHDAAYEIDFHYGTSANHAVIHDLRIEHGGRVAQIDHLIINRAFDMWVCETKAFAEGIRIDDHGEWYRYGGGRAHGMPSPVKQNQRHVEVLKALLASGDVALPKRLGLTLRPTLFPVVLISNGARIDRPKSAKARATIDGLDTVIKVERLVETINRSVDTRNPLGLVVKLVSAATVADLGARIVALHQPHVTDWAARFGLRPIKSIATGDPATRATCVNCGKGLSERETDYVRLHAVAFAHGALCYRCQRSAQPRSA